MSLSVASFSGLSYRKSNCSEGHVSIQIDYNDPRYAQAAAEILRRHDAGDTKANITNSVSDFLIVKGLIRGDEIVQQNLSAQGSLRDLRSRPERGWSGVRV